MIEFAVVGALSALMLVCAWKFWHGAWLRLISGNTFATDEELKSPYQRRVGKRAAVTLALCAAVIMVLPFLTALSRTMPESERERFLLLAALGAAIAMAAVCAWFIAANWKDAKETRRQELAEDESLDETAREQAQEKLREEERLDARAIAVLAAVASLLIAASLSAALLNTGAEHRGRFSVLSTGDGSLCCSAL